MLIESTEGILYNLSNWDGIDWNPKDDWNADIVIFKWTQHDARTEGMLAQDIQGFEAECLLDAITKAYADGRRTFSVHEEMEKSTKESSEA